jgi:hypothetical protein
MAALHKAPEPSSCSSGCGKNVAPLELSLIVRGASGTEMRLVADRSVTGASGTVWAKFKVDLNPRMVSY